jgi:hypothetical protein
VCVVRPGALFLSEQVDVCVLFLAVNTDYTLYLLQESLQQSSQENLPCILFMDSLSLHSMTKICNSIAWWVFSPFTSGIVIVIVLCCSRCAFIIDSHSCTCSSYLTQEWATRKKTERNFCSRNNFPRVDLCRKVLKKMISMWQQQQESLDIVFITWIIYFFIDRFRHSLILTIVESILPSMPRLFVRNIPHQHWKTFKINSTIGLARICLVQEISLTNDRK